MKPSKIEKQQRNLIDLGAMEEDDTLVDFLVVNYVKKVFSNMGSWTRGWGYFTERKLIIPTGLLENNIIIPYSNIQELKKCNQGLFPMGIAITYKDMASGEIIQQKISLSKRDKWIDFMKERINR